MRRGPALVITVVLLAALPLAASASQPRLSAADRGAVRGLHVAAAALRPTLVQAAKAATASVARDYAACKARYEGHAQKATIDNALTWMAYMRSFRLGFPRWVAFERRAMAVPVSNPLLRTAKQTLPWELDQIGAFARMRFDLCTELELLAASDFSQRALSEWADQIRGGSTSADRRLALKMDARVRASRPALRAAGLSSAQAKLMLDTETGTIFAVIFGLL